jgi:hypothetical protein
VRRIHNEVFSTPASRRLSFPCYAVSQLETASGPLGDLESTFLEHGDQRGSADLLVPPAWSLRGARVGAATQGTATKAGVGHILSSSGVGRLGFLLQREPLQRPPPAAGNAAFCANGTPRTITVMSNTLACYLEV